MKVPLISTLLGKSPDSVSTESSTIAVPTGTTLVHVTHWKAGSQWIRAIVEKAFGISAVVAPEYEGAQLLRPVEVGKVYPCVYFSKQEYDSVAELKKARYFVVIRDLRDTLISVYFSVRNSHELGNDRLRHRRRVLTQLSKEDGLLYMLEAALPASAIIHRSWLDAGEPCFKLENMMRDPVGQLEQAFKERWNLNVAQSVLRQLVEQSSFEKLSKGRPAGQEDVNSHYRKGIAGDWKEHFTPKVTDRFKALYNDLLIRGDYEQDDRW
jgi:lipopolysaccharide transport system ATP-binding protein